MLEFLITALAVWRLSNLLVNEDGPADIFLKIRNKAGMKYDELSRPYSTNVLSGILSCVWCCSVWVSFVASVFIKPRNFAYYLRNALALSAMAIMIHEGIDNVRGRSKMG